MNPPPSGSSVSRPAPSPGTSNGTGAPPTCSDASPPAHRWPPLSRPSPPGGRRGSTPTTGSRSRCSRTCTAGSSGDHRPPPPPSTPLCARMLAAADALADLLDELDTTPTATAHGDACTRNLLVTEGYDGFTMIDFRFWGCAPIGFDLGQLLLGEIQLAERPA